MLCDTHAHLNFEAFNEDREEVIKRCHEKNMTIINVGAQLDSSLKAIELTKEDNFYATVALHPLHVFDEEFEEEKFQGLLKEKVVAIGETGLDFFHPTFERAGAKTRSLEEVVKKQKEVFVKHIQLAKKNNLPLILHGRNNLEDRDAYQEMLEILKEEKYFNAVFHFYGGSLDQAKEIISHGFYVGIGGVVTFKKKAENIIALAKEIPLKNILIETDCPWVTPEPNRGKRNEPIYVEFVAEKIAELKGVSKEEVIEQAWQNAKDMFRL